MNSTRFRRSCSNWFEITEVNLDFILPEKSAQKEARSQDGEEILDRDGVVMADAGRLTTENHGETATVDSIKIIDSLSGGVDEKAVIQYETVQDEGTYVTSLPCTIQNEQATQVNFFTQ